MRTTIQSRDEILDAATAYLQRRQIKEAETLLREFVEKTPGDAEAISLLGMAIIDSDTDVALKLLHDATRLEPNEPRFWLHLGIGLKQANQAQQALGALRQAAKLDGGSPATLIPLTEVMVDVGQASEAADILTQLSQRIPNNNDLMERQLRAHQAAGEFDGALKVFDQLTAKRGITTQGRVMRARLLMHLMRYEEAAETLAPAIAADATDPQVAIEAANLALWEGRHADCKNGLSAAVALHEDHSLLLANYLMRRKTDAENKFLNKAEQILAQGNLAPFESQLLNYALADCYDEAGTYDKAWHYYQAGNVAQNYTFDITAETSRFQKSLALYQTIQPNRARDADPDQLYIMGPPRSGGSLMQSILCAAPNVGSLGERGALLLHFMKATSFDVDIIAPQFEPILASLRDSDLRGAARVTDEAAYLIDKTPHHIYFAGLIQRIHPQAKFLHMRRDPREVLMSIYCHSFPATYNYSAAVEDIAAYLGFHEKMVTQWQSIGLPIHIVNYQKFQQAPEVEAQSIFEFADIAYSSEYLRPEKRNNMVKTFSAAKVRSPISTGATKRWDKYREYIPNAEQIEEQLQQLPS